MKSVLTITFAALILVAPALADTVPEGAKLYFWEPVGNGDPNAISCYVGRETPPYRFVSCKRNLDWARMNAGDGRLWSDTRGEATLGPGAGSFEPSPRARELSGS